jgi:phage baseplate assembly protein W
MQTQPKVPIGIAIPIRKTESAYFDQTYDTLSQVRANIINLLNTRPGERRMQPGFGSRLWNLAFEQHTEMLPEMAKRIVEEDIGFWIPGVSVLQTNVSTLKSEQSQDDRDIYRLYISVQFMVNSTKQTDVVEFNVDRTI